MGDLNTKALQLNIEGLMKLLGGTSNDRLKFWEIKKGITTPIEMLILNQQMDTLATLVKQVEAGTKNLKNTAGKIANRS